MGRHVADRDCFPPFIYRDGITSFKLGRPHPLGHGRRVFSSPVESLERLALRRTLQRFVSPKTGVVCSTLHESAVCTMQDHREKTPKVIWAGKNLFETAAYTSNPDPISQGILAGDRSYWAFSGVPPVFGWCGETHGPPATLIAVSRPECE